MTRNVQAVVVVMVVIAAVTVRVEGLSGEEMRRLLAKNQTACLLVFGDSSVDAGNNNRLATTDKSNFLPYGRNYGAGDKPTGRFTNGRLATDFIGEVLGCGKSTMAFLDMNLTPKDLVKGVSFASAGSGYDDLTANLAKVLPLSRQLKYLQHYRIHLAQAVGFKEAVRHIRKAAFVLSMGSNDFLQNYFVEPTRPKQYTLENYQNFLISSMHNFTKEIHKLGARRLVLVSVPNLGCMPISIMVAGSTNHQCVETLNKAASSFNTKLVIELKALEKTLKIKTAYADVFGIIQEAINNPTFFGFKEISKGCCGTGLYEYGETCKGLTSCHDPSKYIFWDAIHPSEQIYKIAADSVVKSIPYDFFS